MRDKILAILQEIRPELDFTESSDFITDGYLDSFDMVSLISALDKTFGIAISIDDVLPENFENIDAMLKFLQKYR